MSLAEKFLIAVIALVVITIVVEFVLWNIDRERDMERRDREEGDDDDI